MSVESKVTASFTLSVESILIALLTVVVEVLEPIDVKFSRVLILGCEGADTVTADSDAPDKFPVKLFALISP